MNMRQVLFIVSVGAFCIMESLCGSEHAQFMEAFANSHHEIYKRSDVLNQLRVCRGIIADEQCSNGLAQASADLLIRCNLSSMAELVVDRCRRNLNGDYCNIATTYLGEVNMAFGECVLPGTPCTERCRNLLMTLRDNLGCCLNLEFNRTSSPVYSPAVFTSTLWSNCGIEPITTECTPRPFPLSQNLQGDTCSTNSLLEQNTFLVCNEEFTQPIVNRLTNECRIYGQAAIEQCGIDESDQPCYLRAGELNDLFTNVSSICQASDTSTCNLPCTNALRDLSQSGGCCINNFFNGSLAGITTTRYSWLSNQYWSACGISSPGFCDTVLNNGTALIFPTITPQSEPSASPTTFMHLTQSTSPALTTVSVTTQSNGITLEMSTVVAGGAILFSLLY